jgi:hypothetical protein
VCRTVHRLPFHRSARLTGGPLPGMRPPTAMHEVADVHATPVRIATRAPSLGVGRMLHRDPFHRSASVPLTCVANLSKGLPTAMQADGDVHATLSSMLPCTCAGFGVGTMLHFLPFQRSANVPNTRERFRERPTAIQAEADGHDTSNRLLTEAPRAFGVGWTLHREPFHRSASVTLTPEFLTLAPTAVQDEAAEQDTEKNWPLGPTGFALGTIDHPRPEAVASLLSVPINSTTPAIAAALLGEYSTDKRSAPPNAFRIALSPFS